jgi:hypothetical protein
MASIIRRSAVHEPADAAPIRVFVVVGLVVDQYGQVKYGKVVDSEHAILGTFSRLVELTPQRASVRPINGRQ